MKCYEKSYENIQTLNYAYMQHLEIILGIYLTAIQVNVLYTMSSYTIAIP